MSWSRRYFLLASNKVLPSILLPAYDLAIALRDGGVGTVGGFQTSLERECLEILLRGSQTVTICPARTFNHTTDRLFSGKLWAAVKQGVRDGRVSIVEPPGMVGSRVTRANAARRNEWLLDQADQILFLYASPGGETNRLVRLALERQKPVRILDHPANHPWINLGATVWS